MNRDDFHVGQMLFVALNAQRGSADTFELPVQKIGRKWLTIGEPGNWRSYRVDVESMLLDGQGYSSPGKCYLYREDWERENDLHKAWNKFRIAIPYRPPSGVTVQMIERAYDELRLGEKT